MAGMVLASAATMAVVGAGGSASAASGATANEVAARSDARSLLVRLRLPGGAVRSAREPTGDGGSLARPAVGVVATPTAIDESAFWTLRASPLAVLAFVKASPPAGSKMWVSGSGSGPGSPGYSYEGFQWPAIANVIETRHLIVEVTSLSDGMTGVRADAQLVPITPRGSSERIPAGATRLSVTGTARGGRQIQIATVTSPAKIRAVIALLDGLPLLPPEHPFECGPSVPEPVRLAFYANRGGAPLAKANFEPYPTTSTWGWCSTVGLTIDGTRHAATAPRALVARLRALAVPSADQPPRRHAQRQDPHRNTPG
jgi:hypothetical protein